jgi:glucose/arabinose dehydrogenase
MALLALAACGKARGPENTEGSGIRLNPVFRDVVEPVHVASLPGDDRVFITEQAGRVLAGRAGREGYETFLDIRDRVGSGGERGLLSIAFHPRFRANGRVFVNYTDRDGHTNVVEFRADTAATRADPASARRLLSIRQPYANHNGGHILFGPDGRLYVAMGDGGSSHDPGGRAQAPHEVLGKLLRLDVDAPVTAESVGTRGDVRSTVPLEIYALGLRNPWRIWFDSGLIYIADVGQSRFEEINVAPADSAGINYGWRTMEGAHCRFNPVCNKAGLHLPVLEYGRADGCSVIGGVVYRGRRIPALAGHYLYSDWCQGWIRSFRAAGESIADARAWDVPSPGPITSFGVGGDGEVYVTAGNGTVYRIEPR